MTKPAKKLRPVTIVVPVYGDWPSLNECISSLKKHVDNSRHKVMLVNDCGPEADAMEHNILKAINGCRNFEYHRNPKNLGFVKTCNRAALELDKSDNDILLLNSDTKVTKGFLDAMLTVLYSSSKIAAVCPRSNNATIFSVPLGDTDNNTYPLKDAYKAYRRIRDKLPERYLSPIAHGFCMLIRRSVIDKYGLFDEVYGRGYGEENDFCMRVLKQGYSCAVANRAFVFHFKGKSFSSKERDALVAKNEKVLKKRYPEYEKLVKEYIDNMLDPAEWLAAPKESGIKQRLSRLAKTFSR